MSERQRQLVLIDRAEVRAAGDDTGAAGWQLDEHTRAIGRQGIAAARQALASARARHHDDEGEADGLPRRRQAPAA